MYQGVTEHIDELIKIGKSPLGEGKDLTNPAHLANIEKKKARGVVAYYAYELNLDGVIWNVKPKSTRVIPRLSIMSEKRNKPKPVHRFNATRG